MKTINIQIKYFQFLFFSSLIILFSLQNCSKDKEVITIIEIQEEEEILDDPSIDWYDDCLDYWDLGYIEMLPESESFYVYKNINTVYFRDSSGVLAAFQNIGSNEIDTTLFTFDNECPEDTREIIHYEYKRNTLSNSMKNDSLGIEISTIVGSRLHRYGFSLIIDLCSISLFDIEEDKELFYGNVTIDQRNFINFSTDHDSLNLFENIGNIELLNQAFQDVYSRQNDFSTIFVNKDFGIIGFLDLNQNIWVFDHME